jgi:HK97 family phage major capsid protein/HK97 family phage prohead protease
MTRPDLIEPSRPDLHQTRHLDLNVRFTADEAGIIEGIASRWNEEDAYGDVVQRGAFSASLAEHRANGTTPAMLWLHDQPAGVWDIIEERADGLYVRGKFALATETGRQAYEHAKAGTTTGLSIGFRYVDVDVGPTGTWIVKAVDLHEISLTPTPAAPRARIANVRSIGGIMPELNTPETVTAEQLSALAEQVRTISASLDEREVRSQRPGAPTREANSDADNQTRAFASFLRTGDDAEIRAISGAGSDLNQDGGWTVLPTVDMAIRNLVTDLSPMRGLAEVVTISTATYERFYSLGKRGARWVSERDDRPQDTARPELIKQSYGVAELYAAPTATRHLLEDSAVDIAGWLIDNATHDFAETEGEAFWTGDGVDGRPKGLLTYPTTNEKDFARAWGSFQYVPAGHASAPTDAQLADALVKLIASLRKPYKGGAAFVMNSNTAVRLRTIKDGDGRYLWAPTGNLIEGIEHPLLGYSVEIDDLMPDIGAGSYPVAFGDLAQGYVIVDRQGVRVERDAVTVKGRTTFDTYKRVGGGAGDFNAVKFLKITAS